MTDKHLGADARRVQRRIAELERICAELYQVIGVLAEHAGCFDHPDVQRALDNASRARLQHRDLLPWPKSRLKKDPIPNAETLAALEEGRAGKGRIFTGSTEEVFKTILSEDDE